MNKQNIKDLENLLDYFCSCGEIETLKEMGGEYRKEAIKLEKIVNRLSKLTNIERG